MYVQVCSTSMCIYIAIHISISKEYIRKQVNIKKEYIRKQVNTEKEYIRKQVIRVYKKANIAKYQQMVNLYKGYVDISFTIISIFLYV